MCNASEIGLFLCLGGGQKKLLGCGLLVILIKGFKSYSFQLRDLLIRTRTAISFHCLPVLGLGNFSVRCPL